MTADGSDKDKHTIWEPRQMAVAQEVAQYSRFVSAMKLALPIAAGFLLLLVVVLPQFRNDDERFRIGMELVKGSSNDSLSMTNARYFGTDDKGQPFTVTAQGVRQQAKEDVNIGLVAPQAEISLTNGSSFSAAASNGLYDREAQKLDLAGEVTVIQNQGNQIKTSAAIVMLKEGTATGRQPVSGAGTFGTMQAEGGFDLSESGRIVVFHGPAKLTLNADTRATAAPPAPAEAGTKP